MKTGNSYHFLLISVALAGFLLLTGQSYAQQKTEDQSKSKKTITIHVTKVVDGNSVVIDTTIVTDADFDADAFLREKGVMDDESDKGAKVEKDIIIRHPDTNEFTWSESDGDIPDTLIIDDGRVIIFNDKYDMPVPPPPPGMSFDYNFDMPHEYLQQEGMQFEAMLEGMARSFGLENVMPFGEMKQVVVKKKRNGKKVIITFEDRDRKSVDHAQGKKEVEKVIIYKNHDQDNTPQSDNPIIIEGKPGEKMVIEKEVRKTENGTEVIMNTEVDKATPVKKEKKIIIITEDDVK